MNLRLAPSAALLPFTLLVHTPTVLFFPNREEFAAPPVQLLAPFCLPFAAMTGAVWWWLARSSPPAQRSIQMGLLALSILASVQSLFLVHGYGLLTGERLDFTGRGHETATDLTVLALVASLLIFSRRRLREYAGFATVAMLTWLATSAVLAALMTSDRPRQGSYDERFDSLSEASSSFNVFHIMLDSFQADVFSSMLEADPRLRSELEGFTFFRDQAGNANWTTLSFLPMWGAEDYFQRPAGDREPIARLRELLEGAYPAALEHAGVHVGLVVPGEVMCPAGVATCLTLQQEVRRRLGAEPSGILGLPADSLFIADLSLFRLSPTPLKPFVYRNGQWALSQLATTGHGSHEEALELLLLERQIPRSLDFFRRYYSALRIGGERPAYHFVHVYPPHKPFVLDAECRVRKLSPSEQREQFKNHDRGEYEGQARCAWRSVEEFLGRLRTLGLYDRSAVLIESDHGLGIVSEETDEPAEPLFGLGMEHLRAFANPLLLAKPPRAAGALVVSDAPTNRLESAPTVLRWLGMDHPLARRPGLFEIGEGARRVRRFVLSGPIRPSGGMEPFHVFRIDGPVLDPGSWTSAGIFDDVGKPLLDRSRLPLEIRRWRAPEASRPPRGSATAGARRS